MATFSSTPSLRAAEQELALARSAPVATQLSTLALRMSGRRTPSQRRARGRQDRIFSIATPMTWPQLRVDNVVYPVVQMTLVGSLSSSASLATFAAYNFTLASLDQYTTLVTLFDQYRFKEVEIMFSPRTIGANGTSTNTGQFATVVDYDDSSTLGTYAQALDYQNVQTSYGTDGHYHRFKPHAAVAAYSGSFSSYANLESPWIDCASSSVQHYGVKTAWTVTDTVYTFDLTARFQLEFRNVR